MRLEDLNNVKSTENPKLFVVCDEIGEMTGEYPYGFLSEIIGYRIDDEGSIYLLI